MTTLEQALSVKCPTCKMGKNKPCVYADIQQNVILGRVGLPTSKPHGSRATKAWHKGRAEKRKAEEAARTAEQKERSEILRANADALAAEHQELRRWLRRNVGILITRRNDGGETGNT